MRYPKFINNGDTIGICAPSSGVGDQLEGFELSLDKLKKRGYTIYETKSVRNSGDVSNTSIIRANEVNECFLNDDVSFVMCARGGEFLTDILPFIDYDLMSKNPKWLMGYSDPTNLLYTYTTCCDVATIYGHNAASFDSKHLHSSQEIALDVIGGKIVTQESFPKYEKNRDERVDEDYNLTEDNIWLSNKDNVDITGRIIGGCLDCLRYLPGTKYDQTNKFLEKYKSDGFIWYFDIFSLSADDTYLSLFQLKEAGWFKYCKGVIVGRVLFPSSNTTMTYDKAFSKIFDTPIIMDADIGHVAPKMTIINGSIAHIKYSNHKGSIELNLK